MAKEVQSCGLIKFLLRTHLKFEDSVWYIYPYNFSWIMDYIDWSIRRFWVAKDMTFTCHYTVWKLREFTLTRIRQKFRESNSFHWWVDFTKYFISESEFLGFQHCDVHYQGVLTYILRFHSFILGNQRKFAVSADTKHYSLNVLRSNTVCQKMNCS